MYLLYLDDSGSVRNSNDTHVVLAGLAVHERRPHWLSSQLDELATRLYPEDPNSLEFRGNAISAGRGKWRRITRARRQETYETALGYVNNSSSILFGAAINKTAVSPDDPVEYGFEQIANRFDRFLGRLHKQGNTQRGLIVLDQSSYETSLQTLAREFRLHGHRWGQLYNMADVPLFVDSRATRLIQYADLIAYAVGRCYLKNDPVYFNMISGKFDREGGVLHGLTHYAIDGRKCDCFACKQYL